MKLLHVNIGLAGGGLEQYLVNLFKELEKAGHRNAIVYGEKAHQSISLPGITTYCIENITHLLCDGINSKLTMVEEIIDREDPDLVYIHQVLNSSLIKLVARRRPTVRFVHGFKLVCPDGRKNLKAKGAFCFFPLGYSCQARAYRYRCMPRNPFIGLPLLYNCMKIAHIHRKHTRMVVASEFMKSVLLYNGFKEDRVSVIPYFWGTLTMRIPLFLKTRSSQRARARLEKQRNSHR